MNTAGRSTRRVVVTAALSVGVAFCYGWPAPAVMASPGQPGLVASVALPGGVSAVAVQGSIVAATSASSISIIDANSLAVRSTVKLPQAPNPDSKAPPEVVLTSDGALAYVLAGQGLFVVDTAAGTLIRWVEIPLACLSGMTISPDGGRLNVIADCNSTDSAICAIDPVTLLVV